MATSRENAVAELRRSIDVLPERTRKAMLIGLENNTVITGAFAGGNGACPMLAAHREGGRTSVCTFPEAWDKFCGVYGRQIVRPATQYEMQILCQEIQASLQPLPDVLSDAIAEYKSSVEASRHAEAAAEQERREIAAREAAAPPRKRRLRITGGHMDLSEAIDEHKDAARSRRSREAEDVGLDWLFESTLVLPEDFEDGPVADEAPAGAEEFDFDSAEAQLTS